MSTRNGSDDEAAWTIVARAMDEALELEGLSDSARGTLTRSRGLIGARSGVPALRVASTPPPPLAEVIPIDGRAE